MRNKNLTRLFDKNQSRLYACALAITKNREAAEDAVHDALLAVAGIENEPDNLEAYLYRTVRNKALYLVKMQSRSEPLEEDYLDVNEKDADLAILARQVKLQIAILNLNEQQAVILKLFEDLTFREIAVILDTPENTVASWYRRGIQKLTEVLDG